MLRIWGGIAILTFHNGSGKIPSTGLQLPYTFKDEIRTICQYYNGNSNVNGELRLYKNGTLYVYGAGGVGYTDATYVLGSIVAVLN